MADWPEHMQIEYGVYVPSDAEQMVRLLGGVQLLRSTRRCSRPDQR